MNEAYKPQKGDIRIDASNFGYRAFICEDEYGYWRDLMGYITRMEEYALKHAKGMEVIHRGTDTDGRDCTYYRKPLAVVQVPVTPATVPSALDIIPTIAQPAPGKKAIMVTAHSRESYTRAIKAKAVTFQCAHCGQTVTQERYPSPKPMYCTSACKKEVEREQTRARVQRLRAGRKAGSSQG